MDKILAALTEEREACVRRKATDRVAAIDAEIARLRNIARASEDVVQIAAPVETASVEKTAERAVRTTAKRRKA
jgi:hypothetical protein